MTFEGVLMVWRARRIPMRKVLEQGGMQDTQERTRLHAEKMSFIILEFTQLCEAEPERVKKTKPCSEDMQEHTKALCMDSLVAGF